MNKTDGIIKEIYTTVDKKKIKRYNPREAYSSNNSRTK